VSVLEQISHFGSIPIDLEVELGRQQMTIEEILGLGVGSVIRIARSAGENIDILAGGHLMGSGEIVIIEERFGVRITDFKEES
jgi:flagellar motor switch protein FliN